MKRALFGAISLGLLAGCSTPHYVAAPGVMAQQEGTTVIQGDDGNYFAAVSFRRPYTDISEPRLRQCLAMSAPDESAGEAPVMLHDIRTSPNLETNYAQGSVATDQGKVNFRLEMQLIPDTNYYYFDQLQWSDGDQDGRAGVGAWEGADPIAVRDALRRVTETLQGCFARSGMATNLQ